MECNTISAFKFLEWYVFQSSIPVEMIVLNWSVSIVVLTAVEFREAPIDVFLNQS